MSGVKCVWNSYPRERAIFDLAPLTVRLAQEDTAIHSTVGARAGGFGDVHNKQENAREFE